MNDEDLLKLRLEELVGYFVKSSYPEEMVREVVADVLKKPRVLGYKDIPGSAGKTTPWIITYGVGYAETKEKVQELNTILESANTWKNVEPALIPKLQVVTRRAPNLKDVLFKRKALALGLRSTATVPCSKHEEHKRGRRCQTCILVSGASKVTSNGKSVSTSGGDCKSKSIIYAATCKLCSKNNVYIGKTVSTLSQRVNGHRSKFHSIVKTPKQAVEEVTDENILGAHLLLTHGLRKEPDFNSSYKFDVVFQGAPNSLRTQEQSFIDRLGTLYPLGLNQIKSVSG